MDSNFNCTWEVCFLQIFYIKYFIKEKNLVFVSFANLYVMPVSTQKKCRCSQSVILAIVVM